MKKRLMRIISLGLSIVMIVGLTVSCGKKNKAVVPSQSFSCTVSLEYGGMDIEADLQHPMNGSCTLTVTQPSTLSGTKIIWQAGKLSLSYMGMSFDINADDVPGTAFVPHVMEAIEEIVSNGQIELAKDETGEACIYEGICDAGSFTAQIDSETGVIRSIEIPAYDNYIVFSNFRKTE